MPAGLPDVASGVVDTAIGYLFTEGYVLSGWSVQRLLTKARYSQGDVIIQLLSELVFSSCQAQRVWRPAEPLLLSWLGANPGQ